MIDAPGRPAIVWREYWKEASRCTIQAGFDVPFQYPLWSGAIRQHCLTLFHCICAASFLPKPVRVRIGLRFCNGVQGLQIQRLHGPVLHCRDTPRAFFPVRFRDIHPSQRESFVASLLHLVYGHPLCFRVFPGDFINSRSVLAWVCCPSSDSKGFAAERVGQQVLQGLHLVPLTGLHCLNDTRLQPTHVLMDRFPWNRPWLLLSTPHRMKWAAPPYALLSNLLPEDDGERTCTFCRASTPRWKRSVRLSAPQSVDRTITRGPIPLGAEAPSSGPLTSPPEAGGHRDASGAPDVLWSRWASGTTDRVWAPCP